MLSRGTAAEFGTVGFGVGGVLLSPVNAGIDGDDDGGDDESGEGIGEEISIEAFLPCPARVFLRVGNNAFNFFLILKGFIGSIA